MREELCGSRAVENPVITLRGDGTSVAAPLVAGIVYAPSRRRNTLQQSSVSLVPSRRV
jgi:hypothetical protein